MPVVPSTTRPDFTNQARELFGNLSISSHSQVNDYPASNNPFENPRRVSRVPPQLERDKGLVDIFADPPKPVSSERSREKRRPRRRNSESSIMDKPSKFFDASDEERRRRERKNRERDGHPKDRKHHSSKKTQYQLDIIDKLDVTSIYGTGMFHHDGPFDACNPNRNRKGMRATPMQAFPKDSANMALGGAGPVNSKMDYDLFHGITTEAHTDFSSTGLSDSRRNDGHFDTRNRVDPVHGVESLGLGTSTFLEGTPASRAAIERRQSETETQAFQGGLQRKKSLAQRLRGINNRNPGGRVASPEFPQNGGSISSHIGTIPVNGKSPFFQDYDDAWERKGARIQQADELRPPESGRSRSASTSRTFDEPTRRSNERSWSGLEDSKPNASGGLINRMKSLRKPKPERRMTDD